MDIDKFRARWEDTEFAKSYTRPVHEPISDVIKQMKRRDRREKWWSITRQIILGVPLLVIIGLAILRIYGTDSRQTPLQTVAFIIELAVFCGLLLLNKMRKKYGEPKFWLNHKELLLDEQHRTGQNIRFDQWTSVLFSGAVTCVGLYTTPLLPQGQKLACLVMTAAVIIILQQYDRRRISELKFLRDDLATQLDDLLRLDTVSQ
jgi:hypothetical protein